MRGTKLEVTKQRMKVTPLRCNNLQIPLLIESPYGPKSIVSPRIDMLSVFNTPWTKPTA